MDVLAKLEAAKKRVKIGEKFVHYKSPEKPYRVVNVALMESDTEPCVVYQAEHGENLTWVRPFTSFFGQVESDGKMVDRFQKL